MLHVYDTENSEFIYIEPEDVTNRFEFNGEQYLYSSSHQILVRCVPNVYKNITWCYTDLTFDNIFESISFCLDAGR